MPYSFTQEDFNKFSQDILQAGGDQATLTSLLADMGGTITDAVAKDIASTERVEAVTAENERLKKANMDLFLRIGTSQVEEQKKQEEQEQEPKSVNQYLTDYFTKIDSKK